VELTPKTEIRRFATLSRERTCNSKNQCLLSVETETVSMEGFTPSWTDPPK